LLFGLVAIGLTLAGVLFAARAPDGVPGLPYSTVHATVPNVGNLRVHNDVRIAGLLVGQVEQITSHDGWAKLTLQMQPSTGPLPADTQIRIRGRGLLGARYVELVPGRSQQALRDGQVITGGLSSFTYGVPETLDTFDTETRGNLRPMLGGLAYGLLGRGQGINDALRMGSHGIQSFVDLAGAIEARPGAAGRLLPAVDSGMTALADARGNLTGLLSPLASTLAPIRNRQAEIRATLDAAPTALDHAIPGLSAGTDLLRAARSLSLAASDVLPPVPSGLAAANALLRRSPAALNQANALLAEATGAVPALRGVLQTARPVLQPLRQTLTQLASPIALLGRHACDIENFGANWRSFLGFGAPGGGVIGPLHSIRIEVIAGPESFGGEGPALKTGLVRRDPYPEPCRYSPGPVYTNTNITGARR
jgi:virulence factor Mce-like protein